MSRGRVVLFSVLGLSLLAALPALAQTRPRASLRPTPNRPQVGVTGQVFVPGFGYRPIINELGSSGGFHRRHGFRHGSRFGFGSGFGGFFGGFSGRNFFGYGYVPYQQSYQSYQSYQQTPTVIVIQQPAESRAPQRVVTLEEGSGAVVVAGLPDNWNELDLEEAAVRRNAGAGSALTLLALKDETLFSVSEYWLEDGLVFYVTPTGRQGSVPLRALDWETTSRLNAEQGLDFVLRPR